MGAKSTIEWTETSWNPLTGCELVSPGCDNCYAARESAGRLKNLPQYVGLTVAGAKPARFTGEVRLLPERLTEPLHWREPRRVFVNSMSDLFHKDVPDEFIAQVFAVMAACPRHTFQILTKRPQRMAALLGHDWSSDEGHAFTTLVHDVLEEQLGLREACYDTWPLPNVWLGTSIEKDTYSFRADYLRATPAAVRFISAEPLLGPLPSLDLTDIDWLIVGGESGPGARPMHPDWARDLRDRCCTSSLSELSLMQVDHDQPVQSSPDSGESRSRAGRPDGESAPPRGPGAPPPEASSYACERPTRPAFFFKQWGEWRPFQSGDPLGKSQLWSGNDGDSLCSLVRLGKSAAGRSLDGREWSEYPR